jgi:hypothetical protein
VSLSVLVMATFAYEGALFLGAAGLVFVAWQRADRDERFRLAAIALGVLGLTGGWALVTSPKAGVHPTPFSHAGQLVAANFGVGVLPRYTVVLSAAALLVVAWSIGTVVLRAFRARTEERLVLTGLLVLLLGALPFMAAGFPFATDGFFDRGNLFADLGTALLFASALAMLWRMPAPAAAPAAAGLVVIALAVPQVSDVNNFARAGRDGRRFLAAVDSLPAPLRSKGPITFVALPSHGGVSEFIADYDISAALAVRYHTGYPYPVAQMAVTATGYAGPKGPTYALVGLRLVERPPVAS